MTKNEALKVLSDGHTIITASYAKKVCKAVSVSFDERLVQKYHSDTSGNPKGLTMAKGNEGVEGVYTLDLSRYVASKLGVLDKAANCLGRGFQAQAYADQIKKVLKNK